MGNNPSRTSQESGSAGGRFPGSGPNSLPPRREPRRRDSLQALSSAKAVAAPPTESHTSATAQSTSQHRSTIVNSRTRSKTIDNPDHAADRKQGRSVTESRKETSREKNEPTTSTLPVAVPPQAQSTRHEGNVQPSGPPQDVYHVAPTQMQRPPRLPLPIEEEVYTPGSPIISPADLSSALDHDSVEGALPRKTSLLSSTTLGEDDEDESYQHPTDLETPVTKTIPTTIEWRQGGDKVYVTGTFAAWDRKFRLHRGPNPDILSTTVQLSPGTHHIKFIVDGEMKLADDLPTAVDYTNILVNYIEVSADDIPQEPAKPVDIVQPHPPPGVYPPQVLPPTPEVSTQADKRAGTDKAQQAANEPGSPRDYGAEFPEYLSQLDQPEESPQYQKAINEVGIAQPPPTLPLFLGKSILNGTSLMKDDASVLNLPNHTVLNHLATSSIKHGVLATSATTRYKRKYVSTILYKPTHEDM